MKHPTLTCMQKARLCLGYLFCCSSASSVAIESPDAFTRKYNEWEKQETHRQQAENRKHNHNWKMFFEAYSQLNIPIIVGEIAIGDEIVQQHQVEIIYANDSASELLGYETGLCREQAGESSTTGRATLKGRSITDLMLPEDAMKHGEHVKQWIEKRHISATRLEVYGRFFASDSESGTASPCEPNLIGFMSGGAGSVAGKARMLTLMTADGAKKQVHAVVSFFGCKSGRVKGIFQFVDPQQPFVFCKPAVYCPD